MGKLKLKLKLWLLAVLVCAGTAFAQGLDVVGTWQGTLQPQGDGRPQRAVLKMTKDDSGALKTAMYLIDQGGDSIIANTTALKGDTLTIEVAGIGGKYEGKIAADGKSITGNWIRGPQLQPLNLAKVDPDAAWEIPKPAERPKPMAKDANPSFEVATVKPSNPDRQGMGFRLGGRKFGTINTTLVDILKFTYSVQDKQLIGLPPWANELRWEIEGQPDTEGQPNLDQWRIMIKKLLAERFQMKFHIESREMPVYVLSVAKGGPKMAKTTAPDADAGVGLNFRGPGMFVGRNAAMKNFVDLLDSTLLDRPVIDRTELGDTRYDFQLNWQPDASQFGGRWANVPPSDPPKPELVTAMQEQIGLKIEPARAPADVMVFDKLEKPAEN